MEHVTTQTDLSHIAKIAELAAREAGKYLLGKFGHVKVESQKELRDDLLDADLGAEHIILEILRKEFPDYGILSEEAGDERNDITSYWIVDPLDGSANYQHGNPIFASSIALIINHTPVVGVIYLPTRDELFTAIRGCGATLNGKSIQLSNTTKIEEAIIHIGEFERDRYQVNRQQIRELIIVADNAKRMRVLGTSCTDLAWLACGRCDGFIMHGGNAWDVEAGKLLLEEAGGKIARITYDDGHDLTIYTNQHIHQALALLLGIEPA